MCLANSTAVIILLDPFEPGEDFASLQQARPGRLRYLHCDVTSELSIEKAIGTTIRLSGRIGSLMTNAGMTTHRPVLDFDRSQLEKLLNLDVLGAYSCATTVAQEFIVLEIVESFVFTASMTDHRPNRAAPSVLMVQQKRLQGT